MKSALVWAHARSTNGKRQAFDNHQTPSARAHPRTPESYNGTDTPNATRLQVPTLVRYNKDAADPVVTTRRNAYGRQLGSFNTRGDFASEEIEMVFIRAPYVEEVGPGVEVLSVTDDKITAVRQGNVLATAFHPELTDDLTVHGTFLKTVRAYSTCS